MWSGSDRTQPATLPPDKRSPRRATPDEVLGLLAEASAPGWSRTSAPAVSERCSPLSYGHPEPPAGIEPAPRPYKGRVLPLTLRRLDGDGGSRTHSSSVQARCSAVRASSPRCERVDSNHHSQRRRGYSPVSSPVLSVRMEG